MRRFYAGIGSRTTPEFIQRTMNIVAKKLQSRGYILRSGGAKGADTAFESGAHDDKEIIFYSEDACNASKAIARKFHPAAQRLSKHALNLIARNSFQILGKDLNSPVDFVLYWHPEGKAGGTGQALRIAKYLNIPCYNMAYPRKFLNDFHAAKERIRPELKQNIELDSSKRYYQNTLENKLALSRAGYTNLLKDKQLFTHESSCVEVDHEAETYVLRFYFEFAFNLSDNNIIPKVLL